MCPPMWALWCHLANTIEPSICGDHLLLLGRIAVDAAHNYWPSSVVCWCVSHTSEPFINGWTNRDAVLVMDSHGPKESCVRWGSRSPWEWAILGERGTHLQSGDMLPWAVQKRFIRLIRHLGCGLRWAEGSKSSPGGSKVLSWEGTLAPPGEYNWTVHLRRRCGLMSNYFDHLLLWCSVTL